MTTQPEALRLADELDDEFVQGRVSNYNGRRAAAELRRLHEAHDWQYKMAGERLRRIEKLERVNQELLYVVGRIAEIQNVHQAVKDIARAAITKAEEQA